MKKSTKIILGTAVGLGAILLVKKVSAESITEKNKATDEVKATIITIQEAVPASVEPIQVGTANDPDADANAQAVYAKLAEEYPNTVIVNGLTAEDLLNVHALVQTPEQAAAGIVPVSLRTKLAPVKIPCPVSGSPLPGASSKAQ